MAIPNILRNLKTAKPLNPSKPYAKVINAIGKNHTQNDSKTKTTTDSLSDLDLNTLNLVLWDPILRPSKCLKFFEFLVENQSFISFKPDLRTHLTVLYRLVKSRSFPKAEILFKSVSAGENSNFPFRAIACTVEDLCDETKVKAMMFNLMIKVYSNHGRFDEVLEVFDYTKSNAIEIDERTCTDYLLVLKRADKVDLSLDFLYRMVESDLKVSEYALTIVVDGLCGNGEIRKSRELVEEMIGKGTKPNVVTFNTMLNGCAKRWDFVELDLVLLLMKKEGVGFNLDTYMILIDGFASFGKFDEARGLVKEMHDHGVKVDVSLYNLVIRSCCRVGGVQNARSIFKEMAKRNVTPNGDTYWALVSGFCKVGEMKAAMGCVKAMQRKGIDVDGVMLGTLIDGFCGKSMIREAYRLLLVMEVRGFRVDLGVIEKIAIGLFELDRAREANRVLSLMVKRGDMANLSSVVDVTKELRKKL